MMLRAIKGEGVLLICSVSCIDKTK